MTDWAVAEAERLTLEQPHDERRCIWHARALEASGRRGDALAAISRFRRRLRNDLGLGATDLLTEAEQAILADEATLERTPRRGAPIGRQEAVGALLADIRRDRNVVVSGEPGIGVTSVLSLLHTAATRAGMAVARAQCPRGPEPVALVLLEELMADLGTQPTRSWSVLSEFVRALEQRSARDAVLLIVDDVDAAGPTTLRALAEVGSFHGVHLALGTHATAAELHPIDAVEHPLGPLNTHDITRIMVETGAQPGDDEVAAFQTATAGNPLLLHTLLQQESQRLDLAAPPQQLATVVRARLSHLSPRSRDALVWIAAADALSLIHI